MQQLGGHREQAHAASMRELLVLRRVVPSSWEMNYSYKRFLVSLHTCPRAIF